MPSRADSLLQNAALKRTTVRSAVLEILARAGGPLSAVEILEKLPPRTDAVTVYRTLNTFTNKKLIHRVRGQEAKGSGPWRYALTLDPAAKTHQHPHFVCDRCGQVQCLRSSAIPAGFLASLQIDPAYRVHYSEVLLHGLCPKCGG